MRFVLVKRSDGDFDLRTTNVLFGANHKVDWREVAAMKEVATRALAAVGGYVEIEATKEHLKVLRESWKGE